MRFTRIMLVIVAVVCFGVALSYPIRYRLAQNKNNANMDELSTMRTRARQVEGDEAQSANAGVPETGDAVGAESGDAAGSGPARQTVPPEEADDGPSRGNAGKPAPVASGGEAGQGEAPGPAADDTSQDRPESAADDTPQDRPEYPADDTPQDGPESAADGDATQAPRDDSAQSSWSLGMEGLVDDAPRHAFVIATREPSGEGDSTPGDTEGQPPESGEAAPGAEGTFVPEPSGAPELTATPKPTPTPEPTPIANPSLEDLLLENAVEPTPTPRPVRTRAPIVTPEPLPTRRWDEYSGPLPYPMLEKVEFDENAILPELREIYALNHDLVGWITVPGTVIDYPVVQTKDSDYYLEHDFYGNENINGQIILDTLCDPYTPSYNLIISGHHMKNGSMFGNLPEYRTKGYWEKHRFLEFDTLMFHKAYVVFAAFYSADYDEDEEGFRYNANIQYRMEAEQWLKEVAENQLYDTGIDVQFGDEFITLTTCNRARHRNGRFVVVCRRIREGETFE